MIYFILCTLPYFLPMATAILAIPIATPLHIYNGAAWSNILNNFINKLYQLLKILTSLFLRSLYNQCQLVLTIYQ